MRRKTMTQTSGLSVIYSTYSRANVGVNLFMFSRQISAEDMWSSHRILWLRKRSSSSYGPCSCNVYPIEGYFFINTWKSIQLEKETGWISFFISLTNAYNCMCVVIKEKFYFQGKAEMKEKAQRPSLKRDPNLFSEESV